MYVCICNGYRDSEISNVARGGIRCARRAYFELGSGPQCGQCLDMAQDLIDEVHENKGPLSIGQPMLAGQAAE